METKVVLIAGDKKRMSFLLYSMNDTLNLCFQLVSYNSLYIIFFEI